jgi:hypothetical protein
MRPARSSVFVKSEALGHVEAEGAVAAGPGGRGAAPTDGSLGAANGTRRGKRRVEPSDVTDHRELHRGTRSIWLRRGRIKVACLAACRPDKSQRWYVQPLSSLRGRWKASPDRRPPIPTRSYRRDPDFRADGWERRALVPGRTRHTARWPHPQWFKGQATTVANPTA